MPLPPGTDVEDVTALARVVSLLCGAYSGDDGAAAARSVVSLLHTPLPDDSAVPDEAATEDAIDVPPAISAGPVGVSLTSLLESIRPWEVPCQDLDRAATLVGAGPALFHLATAPPPKHALGVLADWVVRFVEAAAPPPADPSALVLGKVVVR